MNFGSPSWLWVLLILPILYFALLHYEKLRKEHLSLLIHSDLWPKIIPQFSPKSRLRKGYIFILTLGLIFIALARPQWGTYEEVIQSSGLDLMLVLDVSRSMEAEDISPNRLKKAKHVIHSLLEKLEGDRVGVVAFAASSFVSCPLTTDFDYLWQNIQMLTPKDIQNQGTDIGTAIETAIKSLENGAESTSKNSQYSSIILLLSDGEDHEGRALTAASKLKSLGARLYILGVGTEKGAPIPIKDESNNIINYKRDQKGNPILSQFQSKFLKKLAEEANGKYWDITSSERELQDLSRELGTLTRKDSSEKRYRIYKEWYQIPLLIGILLLILEISVPLRKFIPLVLLFWIPLANAAKEGQNLTSPVGVESYLETEKGLEAYQAGKLEDAQKNFGAAQALDPIRPELEFNQGIVQSKKGETDLAIQSFQNSARLSEELGQLDLKAKALFNLGSAQAQKGLKNDAIRSYLGALELAEKLKDTNLESKVRKNLELFQEQQKQQKKDDEKKDQQKKKENEQSSEEKSNTDEKKQNQSSQLKDEQNKQLNKGEEKQGENGERKQFHSKKLTPDDAERVMAELKEREKQLQEKLKKIHGRQQNHEKDW